MTLEDTIHRVRLRVMARAPHIQAHQPGQLVCLDTQPGSTLGNRNSAGVDPAHSVAGRLDPGPRAC